MIFSEGNLTENTAGTVVRFQALWQQKSYVFIISVDDRK